jgi:hypothetical protein
MRQQEPRLCRGGKRRELSGSAKASASSEAASVVFMMALFPRNVRNWVWVHLDHAAPFDDAMNSPRSDIAGMAWFVVVSATGSAHKLLHTNSFK